MVGLFFKYHWDLKNNVSLFKWELSFWIKMKENSLEVAKYIQIAKKNYKEGKIYQANEIYRKLIDQKIYTYDLLISYGVFNKDINNLKIAKNLFILSIKKYPSEINSYILLSEILRKENNINGSLKTLQVAKNIDKKKSWVIRLEIDLICCISFFKTSPEI